MRKTLARALLPLCLPCIALCATDDTSNQTNLCSFTTIAGMSFQTLTNAVNTDSFDSLTSTGTSDTKCRRLMNVIRRGNFSTQTIMRQAGSQSDYNNQISQSSDSQTYYYAYLKSRYCQVPTYDEPLTQQDLNNLNKYSGILVQAATGCKASYYSYQIYQQALGGVSGNA